MKLKCKILSGGGTHIPFYGVVPPDGAEVDMEIAEGYDSSILGRIASNGGHYTVGAQRGGSYGFTAGEPIKQMGFSFEVFRPNEETLAAGCLKIDGVGGMHGVPIKEYASEDDSAPRVGERLMIYPAPYCGVWTSPVIEVLAEVTD